MEKEYIVRTKSGSHYKVECKKGLVGKEKVTLQKIGSKDKFLVVGSGNTRRLIDAKRATHKNLKEGKLLFFGDTTSNIHSTSRVVKVFKEAA
jgi:hypothetical protein